MSKREFAPEEIVRSLTLCSDAGKCHETRCAGCVFKGDPNCASNMMTAASRMIAGQAARIGELEEELRWIPVGEGLPKKDGRYHCIVKSFAFPGQTYQALLFCDRHGFREGNIYTDDVTHWKPLSKGPEAET